MAAPLINCYLFSGSFLANSRHFAETGGKKLDLSGAHKLTGSDIKRRDRRGSAADRVPNAQLAPLHKIDPNFRSAWADLVQNASEPNIFYEPWFLEPSLNNFSTNPQLKLFLLWSGEPVFSDLLGLLPIGPASKFGRWPVPHIQNWMHHNCFLGTPLVRQGHEDAFWSALMGTMERGDWPGFLHIYGLTIGGTLDLSLRKVCQAQGRRCDLVHSEARALLKSDLEPEAYYSATVRGKKRKELRRQANRLSELGDVQFTQINDDAGLRQWIDEFLALEKQGWKGESGSALDCSDETRNFFRYTLHGVAKADQLERHDVRLDGKPMAMLVNFLSAPGSFSFKTAFDEEYSRFSPGVLLQHENLWIGGRGELCAEVRAAYCKQATNH